MSKVRLLLLFLFSFSIQAQNLRKNSEQGMAWTVLSGNHTLTNKMKWYTEIQYRRTNLYESIAQFQARTLLEFAVNDQFKPGLGYAFTRTFPYGKLPNAYQFDEHRMYQQISMFFKIGRFDGNHRYRLEERWSEKKILNMASGSNNYKYSETEYKWRFRYRLFSNISLNHPKMEAKTVFIQAFDEVMLQFGKKVKYNIYDQNRAFIGAGYMFQKNFWIVAGYLYQGIPKSDGINYESNNIAYCQINYDLDFRKKKTTTNLVAPTDPIKQ